MLVFENRVLRRIFGPRILVGKLNGKRPLGRPRRREEDNIRMDLREIGWGGMDWIHLAQVGTSGGLL
jgi:hypothetical protein